MASRLVKLTIASRSKTAGDAPFVFLNPTYIESVHIATKGEVVVKMASGGGWYVQEDLKKVVELLGGPSATV